MNEISYRDREDWLQLRKNFIGGSDAAAVIGLDAYKSRYSLWAEKTGKVPEFEGNIMTTVGSYLEELVAKLWSEETGKSVRRKNRMLVNPDYPFACADLDRVVVGEKALLEIKTTNSFPIMRTLRQGDFPDRYYCQMVHYLAVTGFERAYLAVLVNCRELMCFTLERDDAEVEALMTAEQAFWQLVTSDTPPAPDGSDATTEALQTIYADSLHDGEIELFGRKALLDEYSQIKAQAKELDARATEIENIIKQDMGENERGITDGYKVTWKTQERRTFQPKSFAADHPDIKLDDYYKLSTSRPFRITAEASNA